MADKYYESIIKLLGKIFQKKTKNEYGEYRNDIRVLRLK